MPTQVIGGAARYGDASNARMQLFLKADDYSRQNEPLQQKQERIIELSNAMDASDIDNLPLMSIEFANTFDEILAEQGYNGVLAPAHVEDIGRVFDVFIDDEYRGRVIVLDVATYDTWTIQRDLIYRRDDGTPYCWVGDISDNLMPQYAIENNMSAIIRLQEIDYDRTRTGRLFTN